MLAIVIALVFASSAALAVGTIIASFRHHGAQAIALLRLSRTVAVHRDFAVSIAGWPDGPALADEATMPRLRRRGATRPVQPVAGLAAAPALRAAA